MFRNILKIFILVSFLLLIATFSFAGKDGAPKTPPPPKPKDPPTTAGKEDYTHLQRISPEERSIRILERTRSISYPISYRNYGSFGISDSSMIIMQDSLPELIVFYGDSLYKWSDLIIMLNIDSCATEDRVSAVLEKSNNFQVEQVPQRLENSQWQLYREAGANR